jgi:hypothetical protein
VAIESSSGNGKRQYTEHRTLQQEAHHFNSVGFLYLRRSHFLYFIINWHKVEFPIKIYFCSMNSISFCDSQIIIPNEDASEILESTPNSFYILQKSQNKVWKRLDSRLEPPHQLWNKSRPFWPLVVFIILGILSMTNLDLVFLDNRLNATTAWEPYLANSSGSGMDS